MKAPVLDERGEIRQHGGIGEAPGLYVLGLPFLRRRNSHTLDGVGADALDLADHIAARLGRTERAAA
jgi:putative flavoprotein involved in K+ transport